MSSASAKEFGGQARRKKMRVAPTEEEMMAEAEKRNLLTPANAGFQESVERTRAEHEVKTAATAKLPRREKMHRVLVGQAFSKLHEATNLNLPVSRPDMFALSQLNVQSDFFKADRADPGDHNLPGFAVAVTEPPQPAARGVARDV